MSFSIDLGLWPPVEEAGKVVLVELSSGWGLSNGKAADQAKDLAYLFGAAKLKGLTRQSNSTDRELDVKVASCVKLCASTLHLLWLY